MEAYGLTLPPAEAWRLAADTAALVLIWLVQLVIYPAYTYQTRADFGRWHPVYTRRVTWVVMPVMLGQVAVYGWLLVGGGATWAAWVNAGLIAVVWSITFFGAVPLHGDLDREELTDHLGPALALNRVNGWRTALWTVVWLVTVLD